MSEPVSNAEIEDVLSSIRRLVSENTGAARAGGGDGGRAERLVLTPAFRVSEPEFPAAPVADAQIEHLDAFPEDTADDQLDDLEPGDDTAGGNADDDRAEAQDVLSEPVAGEFDEPEAGQDEDVFEPDTAGEDSPSFHPDIAPADALADTLADTLEDRIAELEAAVGDSHEDWEPDGSEDEADTPQTVIFEHAGFGQDTGADTTAETETWPDAAPAGDEPVVAEIPPPAGGDPDEVFYDEVEEAVIDEDALRDLVARLVREELQGSVGERITRNVRRLVRREIQRALTLKDFE